VRRTGANYLSLFQRLGIALVILGMVQSLAPTCFRPARGSLRIKGRLRVVIAILENTNALAGLLPSATPTPPSLSGQDPESDQESHDTEDLTEAFAWSGTLTDRRSVKDSSPSAPVDSIPGPGRAVVRTRSVLQRSRVLPILASASGNVTARLCRFTC
jgi:hypothetical protein